MNQQIKQLTQKSGLIMYRTKDIYNWEYAVEDFAKLIIKECCVIIEDEVNDRESAGIYVDRIKKHFEVEE
jgi:hypothetical protein